MSVNIRTKNKFSVKLPRELAMIVKVPFNESRLDDGN